MIKEYVLPENKIQELATDLRKRVIEKRNYNMLMIFKDFAEKMDFKIHIESYTATGNEYMIFEDEDNKMVWNLTTGEYWGCNEWIRKME